MQPWYLSTTFTVLVGGILPFGACFVEFFFILSSMWMNQVKRFLLSVCSKLVS
jgi:transmembrane 9 superfamily protein 2/4